MGVAKCRTTIWFAPRIQQGITMSVCIRLSRFGRTHRPLYRVVAIDKRCHREGMANEIVGLYDPIKKDKNLEIDATKVESWVNRGAQISAGLRSLMKKYGYAVPSAAKTTEAKPKAKTKKPAAKKAEGKAAFVPATRRAVRKHKAKLKAERKAQTAAAAAAKAAAAEAEKPAEAPAAE